MYQFSRKAIFVDRNPREIIRMCWYISPEVINVHTRSYGFTVDSVSDLEQFLDGKSKYGIKHGFDLAEFVNFLEIDASGENGFDSSKIEFI